MRQIHAASVYQCKHLTHGEKAQASSAGSASGSSSCDPRPLTMVADWHIYFFEVRNSIRNGNVNGSNYVSPQCPMFMLVHWVLKNPLSAAPGKEREAIQLVVNSCWLGPIHPGWPLLECWALGSCHGVPCAAISPAPQYGWAMHKRPQVVLQWWYTVLQELSQTEGKKCPFWMGLHVIWSAPSEIYLLFT